MFELYRNIKKFRTEQRMSQLELALKTGYTDRSSIAKIEKGDVDLPQSKIFLFAQALGVDAGTLMGDTGISDPVLTEDESALLSDYQKLNQTGKSKARDYVTDLTEQKKYTAAPQALTFNDALLPKAAHDRTDQAGRSSDRVGDSSIMKEESEWQ